MWFDCAAPARLASSQPDLSLYSHSRHPCLQARRPKGAQHAIKISNSVEQVRIWVHFYDPGYRLLTGWHQALLGLPPRSIAKQFGPKLRPPGTKIDTEAEFNSDKPIQTTFQTYGRSPSCPMTGRTFGHFDTRNMTSTWSINARTLNQE